MQSMNELMAAAGTLTRAANYILTTRGKGITEAECKAIGTLMGLAYVVRPQKVALP